MKLVVAELILVSLFAAGQAQAKPPKIACWLEWSKVDSKGATIDYDNPNEPKELKVAETVTLELRGFTMKARLTQEFVGDGKSPDRYQVESTLVKGSTETITTKDVPFLRLFHTLQVDREGITAKCDPK